MSAGTVVGAVSRHGPDRRLWWPALGVWLGALAGMVVALRWGPAAAGVAGATTAVPAATLAWRGRHPRRRAVALAGCAIAAGALVMAARVAPLMSAAVDDVVADARRVRVEAVVASDPAPVRPRVAGSVLGRPAVDVRVTVVRMWRGTVLDWRGSVPAVLRADVAAAGLLPGSRIDVVASPLPGDPVRAIGLRLRARSPVTVTDPPPAVQEAAGTLRAGLRSAVEGRPPDAAGLLPGLVLGDVRATPPDLADDMRSVGLSHLVAVSGANVAIVVGAVLACAARTGVRGRGRAAVALLAIAAFVVLVRPQPSVLRAAAMGAVGVVALWSGGRRRGPPALAAAIVVLVLVDPWLAVSWGFALSVAATAGLLLWAGRLADRWSGRFPRLPAWIVEAAAVTVAAQVATAPLLLAMGSPVGLAAVPANLAAAPAVAPATVSGLLATFVSPVWPAAARLVALPGVWAAAWIAGVARTVAGWPGADAVLSLPGTSGTGAGALALAAGGVGAWRWRRRLRRNHPSHPLAQHRVAVVVVALCLVVALLVGLPSRSSGWPPPGWVAVACDVGQGDALVLSAGEATAVVVDAGPDPGLVDRCLGDLGVRTVPAVVLTHFHADHTEGLPGVMRRRSVGLLEVSPLGQPEDQAGRVRGWATDAGVPVQVAAVGERRVAGSVSWRVLWPSRLLARSTSPPNDASVVLLAEVSGVRLLLTGDISPLAQSAVRSALADPRVDVLKVPHHGSRFQDPALPGWSGARVALVSVGRDNDYGHPAPGVIQALAAAGIQPHRTDREGDLAVVVRPDGRVDVVGRGSA